MFPYPGGKSKISKWINAQLPAASTYVEPFSGAFWPYMKSKAEYTQVVYNDLNPQLCNLFKCFRTDPDQLLTRMGAYQSEHRETFVALRDYFFTELGGIAGAISMPDYDVAAIYAYLQTHHFIGHPITATLRYQHIDTDKWSSRYQALKNKLSAPTTRHRLATITATENLDFGAVIVKYDSADTLFYVDPPYWKTEHYYTEGGFSKQDHVRLGDILTTMQGKFALSYYYFPELETMYPRSKYTWITRDFTSPMSAGAALAREQRGSGIGVDAAKHQSTEILIMNY